MTCNHLNTYEAVRRCTINFGKCNEVKGQRDKQDNKPKSGHAEDIKFN